MGTEHNAVLWVALGGLGNDVNSQDLLDFGVDIGDGIDALLLLKLLQDWRCLLTRETEGGNVVRGRGPKSTRHGIIFVVVDDSRNRTLLAGVL